MLTIRILRRWLYRRRLHQDAQEAMLARAGIKVPNYTPLRDLFTLLWFCCLPFVIGSIFVFGIVGIRGWERDFQWANEAIGISIWVFGGFWFAVGLFSIAEVVLRNAGIKRR